MGSARREQAILGFGIVMALAVAIGASWMVLSGSRSNEGAAPATPTATVTVTATEFSQMPEVDAQAARDFPDGYPKVVSINEVPRQIASSYADREEVVQLAPGVFTDLPPGATLRDAAATDVANGFCASKKAFEREYRRGEPLGGNCWG